MIIGLIVLAAGAFIPVWMLFGLIALNFYIDEIIDLHPMKYDYHPFAESIKQLLLWPKYLRECILYRKENNNEEDITST